MSLESEHDSVIFYVSIFSSVRFPVGHKLLSNKSHLLTLDVFSCKSTSVDKYCTSNLTINLFLFSFFLTCSAIYSVVVHF